MLDLLLLALFQATAGEPAPPANPDASTTAATAETAPSTTAPDADPAADGTRADEHRVRCRYERITGSHMPTRVCTTAAHDEELEREARTTLDRIPQLNPQGN